MAVKEICCFIWTALMLSGASTSPTSRPLEHSPSDLAWDDWLQQRSRQAIPPRRITTKSLFVFPNFGAESLPACADGYRPDSLGRCVKVVKVDESAHLQFILDKLNSQFAPDSSVEDEVYDYDGLDKDSSDSSGPFQLSIPIAQPHIRDRVPDESEGSGDIIISHKKEIFNKPPESPPTSAPEVVPEYVNSESIYLDKFVSSNESFSVLPANKTDTGLTVLVSSNGKYGNVTDQTQTIKNETDLVEELENIKQDSTERESSELPTTEKISQPNNEVDQMPLIRNDHETTIKPADELNEKENSEQSTASSISDILDNTDTEIKIAEMLVKQMESLKQQVADKLIKLKEQNNEVHTMKKKIETETNKSAYTTSTSKPLNLNDIQEKIKRLSAFADVTTNTDSQQKLETVQYKNEESLLNPPTFSQYVPNPEPAPDFYKPSSAAPSRGGIYGVVQEERPYWYPSNGWPVDNQPNEENFRDYWLKGPNSRFGVRYEGSHHPAPHPLLYPSRDRISVRHTSVNHRRGREGKHRKRQIQNDRTPMQIYDGR